MHVDDYAGMAIEKMANQAPDGQIRCMEMTKQRSHLSLQWAKDEFGTH
jgi:hypothetical protein